MREVAEPSLRKGRLFDRCGRSVTDPVTLCLVLRLFIFLFLLLTLCDSFSARAAGEQLASAEESLQKAYVRVHTQQPAGSGRRARRRERQHYKLLQQQQQREQHRRQQGREAGQEHSSGPNPASAV